LNLEPLEDRNTPAVTSFLSGGVLVLVGTQRADHVVVSAQADRVVVTQSGASGRETTFAQADVRALVFVGFAGRDTFVNETAVNALAFGGLGRDTLQAGTGHDTLIGGLGHDQLTGDADDRLRPNQGVIAGAVAGGPAAVSRRLTTDPLLVRGLNTLQAAGFGPDLANTAAGLPANLAGITALDGTTVSPADLTNLAGLANLTGQANLSAVASLAGVASLGSGLTTGTLAGVASNAALMGVGSTLLGTPATVPQVSPGASFANATTTLPSITSLDGFF